MGGGEEGGGGGEGEEGGKERGEEWLDHMVGAILKIWWLKYIG